MLFYLLIEYFINFKLSPSDNWARLFTYDVMLVVSDSMVLQRHILGPKEIQLHPAMQEEMQVTGETTLKSVDIINTENACVDKTANTDILQYVKI